MDVRIALTGFGNVGQGLALLLRDHRAGYQRDYGVNLLLVGVADRSGAAVNPNGLQIASLLHAKRTSGEVAFASDGIAGLAGQAFLRQSRADVLVEAASTNFEDGEPGWSYVVEAFGLGMDVVLASKGALVLHFGDMMRSADAGGRRVLFSSTIGAPVPILELADRALVGASIFKFEGILNATTNQILTSMSDGLSYEQGVQVAQKLGVAETDPTLDVDGWDAAAKTVILANVLFDAELKLADVERAGIRSITLNDIRAAQAEGAELKLVAGAEHQAGRVSASVRVERRSKNDTLGALRNCQMGILFHTETLGKVSATVEGTGGVPTALTVIRDLINLSRDRLRSG